MGLCVGVWELVPAAGVWELVPEVGVCELVPAGGESEPETALRSVHGCGSTGGGM